MSVTFLVKLFLVILAISLAIKAFSYGVTAVVKKLTELSSKEGQEALKAKIKALASESFARSNRVAKRVSREALDLAFPKPIPVKPAFDWSYFDTPAWQRKGVLVVF